MEKNRVVWTTKSECGPNRKLNEDSINPKNSGSSFLPFKAAICDGLGGHVSGDVASKIASSIIDQKLEDIKDEIIEANKAILQHQAKNPDSKGMGTTMTSISIDKNRLLNVAHVGDTRCYVFSERQLIKLTEDQNVPGYQNMLKQALGSNDKLKIQIVDFQLQKGDVILLCTDGLYNEISDEYLKKKISDGTSAESLVGEVLLLNPKDNVSAIVINLV